MSIDGIVSIINGSGGIIKNCIIKGYENDLIRVSKDKRCFNVHKSRIQDEELNVKSKNNSESLNIDFAKFTKTLIRKNNSVTSYCFVIDNFYVYLNVYNDNISNKMQDRLNNFLENPKSGLEYTDKVFKKFIRKGYQDIAETNLN